jgi:hypothetical protein
MLATANVMDLFANELTGLRRRPFSFASIAASLFEGVSLGHGHLRIGQSVRKSRAAESVYL